MSAINFITSLARKILARESKGITKIPTQMAAEAKAGEIAARLQNAGLPLNRADEFIKSEQDLVRILNMIESTPPVMREVPSGIRSTREAKVIDMEGKEIPKGSQIMGGKEVENTTGSLMSVPNKKGLAGMEYETDAAIKTRLEKSNKKGIANIKNKMTEIDEAIDNASPGFAGDRKYDAQLVADDLAEKRFGKDFYDLDQKQQMDLYDESFQGLSDSRFKNKPDPEDMAQGGRAGYKSGSYLFEGLKKLGKKYKGSTLGSLLENPKVLGTELSYEGLMEILRMGGMMQDGGRAGFKAGLGKRFLEILKGKPKPKFDAERFRQGPITTDFLENIDKKDLEPFIRSRDTMGPGGYGMYDDFADMPAGLKAAELISRIKTKDGGINYSMAEMFIGKKLKGNESVDELIQMLNRQEMRADGGRAGFANGTGAPSIKYDFDKEQEPMGPNYETNDPKEALKEIVKRMINVDPAKVPLSKDMQLMFDLDRAKIGGQKDIGGGILSFGINKGFGRDDTGMGFEFRKQFKDGSGMTRRSFLKILGGLAAIPIVGKFLKPIKTVKGIKSVPIIKTDNVPGKPEWFDALVNKVVLEGDDVTKRFATADRQSIHQKTLNDGSVVRVTEDMDDGAVRVEYESDANVFEDPVQLQYKKPLPDEGAPNPAAEFSTAESGPVGRQVGPDDYDMDIDEVGGSSIRDLDSDVSKLKEYATGKKPTMKEFVQNKKRKDRARQITENPEAQSDAIVRRQGEMLDYDVPDDAFASGGIARMLGE